MVSNKKKRIIGFGGLILVFITLGIVFLQNHVLAKSLLTPEEEAEHAAIDVMLVYHCGKSGGASECGISVSGSTIEEKIWNGLTSFMTDEQAAGVMGNMAHEGGFNPARHETSFLDSRPTFPIATNSDVSYGIGLIQWSFGRRVRLYQSIKEKDESLWDKYIDKGRQTYGRLSGADFLAKVGDADTDALLAMELCYLKQELDENDVYGKVLEMGSVAEAASYFLERVEVPADIPGQRPLRIQDATKYYNQFHGKSSSGSSSSSTGSSGSAPSCNPSIKGSKNINGAAVALAWPYGTDKKKYAWNGGTGTDLFNEVYPQLLSKNARRPYKGCDGPVYGASCDRFVSTVVRFAGNDPNFATGVGGWNDKKQMLVYASEHPDLWEVIEWKGDNKKEMLRPGDVVIKPTHVAIAVQDEEGEFWIAEAGFCSTYGHISKYHDNFEYIIRSKNGNNATKGVSVTEGVKTASVTGKINSTSGKGNGDINASAIELAWPEDTKDASSSASPRFQEVFKSLPGGPGRGCWAYGKSCSVFVNTVLLYAGAKTGDKVDCPGCIADYMIKSDEWEEIEGAEDMNHSDLQPGDVIVYYQKDANPGNESKNYYKGLHTGHIAIYVETSDGGKIAEASFCHHYGKVYDKAKKNVKRGWAGARVFRWKLQKGGSACNACNSEDNGLGLKEGGMTLAEAKEWIKPYHDEAMGRRYKYRGDVMFQGAHIHDAGCPFGVMNNCVALSQWFVNKYTTIGPNWNNTTDGVGLVKRLTSSKGFKYGTEPRPYAIFSNSEWSSAGHTGVIMGVDQENKKVVVAEASCSSGGTLYYAPSVSEYSFDRIKNWEYAYTDDKLKEGGVSVQDSD